MHTYKVSEDKRHHRYRYQTIGYLMQWQSIIALKKQLKYIAVS
jgi:hypothetical protein